MESECIFPGSYHIAENGRSLLAGCPPEIVKVLLQKGMLAPQHILLPDVAVSQGECQVAVEFPLYQYLFQGDAQPNPAPINLVGSQRRVDAAEELIRLSLFGPTEAEMRQWGVPLDQAESLAREMQWFQPRDAEGKALGLERLVSKTVLDGGTADLGWIKMKRLGTNVFQISSATGGFSELDLNIHQSQSPPYPVSPDLTPTTLVKLGVEILGGSNGFSVTQASSGMALCYNGQYLLIDAIPFLRFHMHTHGIARNQVHALFLSHIHDDHCNVISLLQHNRRIQVLTTPLIYRMMLRKLHLCLDRPEASLEEYFTFVPLAPYVTTNYFGLRITPFYSSHSVPTIGAAFETTHDRTEYRILFTGDTQSLTDLDAMLKAGVISRERYEEIAGIYRRPANLLIADGGEGLIHGDPADALNSPAERIVFLHKDNLAERFDTHFSTASAGKRYTVLAGDTNYELTRTIEFLLEYFPAMPPMWISNLLANQHVLKFNAGDIIIREGAKSEGYVYMILTGHASVIHHDGEKKHVLAHMEAGEIIGEMSIITGQGIRNASIVAQTPVIITAFSELAFQEYTREQKLESELKRMWQNRETLQTLPYINGLQQAVIRELGRHVTREYCDQRRGPMPLTNIGETYSLLMPLEQELVIGRGGKEDRIAPLSAPLVCLPDVDLISETAFSYLLLPSKQAAHLRSRIPAFRYFWEETLGLPIPGTPP